MDVKNIVLRNTKTGEIKSCNTLEDFKEEFKEYSKILKAHNEYLNKKGEESFLNSFDVNWNCFRTSCWAIVDFTIRKQKTKARGNGEGTIYYSDSLQRWVAQYVSPSRKKSDFKAKEW